VIYFLARATVKLQSSKPVNKNSTGVVLKRKQSLTLKAWIDELSVSKVAQSFCLERSTVRKWRDGSQLPKALHMRAIVRLSKGKVSYDAMIEPWAKKHPLDNIIL
jgi:hypothetical protein